MSVTCNRLVVFSVYSSLLHQWNWLPRSNWNIVESGVKHHNPPPLPLKNRVIYGICLTRDEKKGNTPYSTQIPSSLFGPNLTYFISKYLDKKREICWSEENFNLCKSVNTHTRPPPRVISSKMSDWFPTLELY